MSNGYDSKAHTNLCRWLSHMQYNKLQFGCPETLSAEFESCSNLYEAIRCMCLSPYPNKYFFVSVQLENWINLFRNSTPNGFCEFCYKIIRIIAFDFVVSYSIIKFEMKNWNCRLRFSILKTYFAFYLLECENI